MSVPATPSSSFKFELEDDVAERASPLIDWANVHQRAVATSPEYPIVIQRLKSGNENFLDLGCCFGQE